MDPKCTTGLVVHLKHAQVLRACVCCMPQVQCSLMLMLRGCLLLQLHQLPNGQS